MESTSNDVRFRSNIAPGGGITGEKVAGVTIDQPGGETRNGSHAKCSRIDGSDESAAGGTVRRLLERPGGLPAVDFQDADRTDAVAAREPRWQNRSDFFGSGCTRGRRQARERPTSLPELRAAALGGDGAFGKRPGEQRMERRRY